VPQPGTGRIASINMMEERAMRNAYREHPFEIADDEAAAPTKLSDVAQDAPFPDGDFGVPWQLHLDPAKRAPTGSRGSAAPGAARRALSWLTACAMEGFVAYAHSMYPCFVDPAELAGHQTGEQDAGSHRQTADDHGMARPFTNPWVFDEPSGAATAPARSGASRTARFWFRMRRERKTRLAVATLDTLDEQTLKDIGRPGPDIERPDIERPDIERIIRNGDPYTW
jgi:hypothetical protein